MKPILPSVLALIFAATGCLTPWPAMAQTMIEMRAEANAEFEKADTALNKVYRGLLNDRENDAAFCESLRQAQRAWLKYVEFHLESMFPVPAGEDPAFVYGTMFHLEFAAAKTTLTIARTKELEALRSRLQTL